GLLNLNLVGENSKLKQMCFLPSRKQVLLFDISNRIRIFDPIEKKLLRQVININLEADKSFLVASSNGECFFHVFKKKRNHQLILEPYLTSTMQPFPNKVIETDLTLNEFSSICMTQYGNQIPFQ